MKKTIRNTLLIILAMALVATASIFGTIAWLSDEEGAVNVMTLGNVYIDQNEYEYSEDGELVDFTQGKPLLPYVGELGWANTTSKRGAWRQFTMNNVVDKYVTVKNTGSTGAYVRTVFAFEKGDLTPAEFDEYIGVSINSYRGSEFRFSGTWKWDTDSNFVAEIDGNEYVIFVATYQIVLNAGVETIPSLLQVYLDKTANNAQVNAIDGNGNGMYDILAFSQAVQSTGFDSAEEALNSAFGEITNTEEGIDNLPWNAQGFNFPEVVVSAEELAEALADAAAAGSGNTSIVLADDLDLSDVEWTPISVDGYHGAGVITIDGGNNTITGLTAPLFAGGFAGNSGIVIKNLTIADSDIVSTNDQGAGAFIANADSMQVLTLENCHLINSTVYAPDARTGGLVGWVSGYANLNDGPVKTYLTIENCSVINCEITGTAVGGIAGHPGASDYTYTTIENCKSIGNTLTSTDDGNWRVGAVVGTANNGHIVITNTMLGNNTMTQPNGTGKEELDGYFYPGVEVGRFVPSGTGTLEIDGSFVGAVDGDSLNDATQNGEDVVLGGDIVVPDNSGENAPYGNKAAIIQKGGVIDGNEFSLDFDSWDDDYVILTYGGTIKNLTITSGFRGIVTMSPTEDVIIDNVHVGGKEVGYPLNTTEHATVSGLKLIVTNSTFRGWSSFHGGFESASFTNCTFGVGEYYNSWPYDTLVKPFITTVFDDCDFAAEYYLDLSALESGCKVTIKNCRVGGSVVTAANCTDVFGEVELPSWATTIADCIVFE